MELLIHLRTGMRRHFLPMLSLLATLHCGDASARTAESLPPTAPTEIGTQFLLLNLQSIDSSLQTFSANLGVRMIWRDPRLAGQFEHPTALPLDDIWHPEFQIVNQQSLSTTLQPRAIVHPDGQVIMQQRFLGSFSQRMGLRNFPLDRQRLGVRFNAVGSSLEEVKFVLAKNHPSGIADGISLSDWRVMGFEIDHSAFQPIPAVTPVPSVLFSVNVERLRGYYVMKILIPLLLIIAMSYSVFWIPMPIANTRVSVSVTSMLTLIAYRFMIDGLLPRVSYMTRMDTFVLLSTLLVFLALIFVVMTAALEQERPELAARIDRGCRLGFPLLLAVIIGYNLW